MYVGRGRFMIGFLTIDILIEKANLSDYYRTNTKLARPATGQM